MVCMVEFEIVIVFVLRVNVFVKFVGVCRLFVMISVVFGEVWLR